MPNSSQGGPDPYGRDPSDPYGSPDPYRRDQRADPYGDPYRRDEPPRKTFRRVNGVRLWVGGVMTALVAALAAVVAVLLVRGVLDIAVFAPKTNGAFGNATTAGIAGAAALAALIATALLHLLLLAAPQARTFFGWIVTLATAAMMLVPFTQPASWDTRAASAAVYLVIGVTIGFLLSAVARGAVGNGNG